MVRRASLAHHWIEASNHPERVPPEAVRVEGSPGSEEENSTGVNPWMNHGLFEQSSKNKIDKDPRVLTRGVPVSVKVRMRHLNDVAALSKLDFRRTHFTIRARHFRFRVGKQTKIMGILNLTPDSFSGDGCLINNKNDVGQNVAKAWQIIAGGADIIDIGGESTRPDAAKITAKEEIRRVLPTMRRLAKHVKIPISIDTYKEKVAQSALDEGASIVNNIMGVGASKGFLRMVKNYNAAITIMHIRGNPKTMQRNICYRDLIGDIIQALRTAVEKCLEIGIKSDRIIIDPGIGFGKTAEQNLEIINRLADFAVLKQPILIGTSRKSFIGHVLHRETRERLLGTAATVCAAIIRGAHIVRVHDVKEMREIVKMTDAILQSEEN